MNHTISPAKWWATQVWQTGQLSIKVLHTSLVIQTVGSSGARITSKLHEFLIKWIKYTLLMIQRDVRCNDCTHWTNYPLRWYTHLSNDTPNKELTCNNYIYCMSYLLKMMPHNLLLILIFDLILQWATEWSVFCWITAIHYSKYPL